MKEYKCLHRLTSLHFDLEKYIRVLDPQELDEAQMLRDVQEQIQSLVEQQQMSPEEGQMAIQAARPQITEKAQEFTRKLQKDFELEGLDIAPSAEPDMIAEVQKLERANLLIQGLQQGLQLNQEEVTQRWLEANKQDDIESIMNVPPPSDPEMELKVAEFQHKQEMDAKDFELRVVEVEAEVLKDKTQAALTQAKANSEGLRLELEADSKELDDRIKIENLILEKTKAMTAKQKVLLDAHGANEDRKQPAREPAK